jgi:hypothetical protein
MVIITIFWTIHQNNKTYYKMTATTSDHLYLRVSRQFKSVYTLQEKNLTNMSYALPLRSHVRQPFVKSLLSRIWAPAPGMKSWPPAIVRLSRYPGQPHSPSNKPPRSREVWFDKIVTKLLGLSGPQNSTCGQYKIKACPSGSKRCGP